MYFHLRVDMQKVHCDCMCLVELMVNNHVLCV